MRAADINGFKTWRKWTGSINLESSPPASEWGEKLTWFLWWFLCLWEWFCTCRTSVSWIKSSGVTWYGSGRSDIFTAVLSSLTTEESVSEWMITIRYDQIMIPSMDLGALTIVTSASEPSDLSPLWLGSLMSADRWRHCHVAKVCILAVLYLQT